MGTQLIRPGDESWLHLVSVVESLRLEAQKCAEAECWRAALVLIGSTIEAGIIATACVSEHELREQGLWPRRADPTQWTVGDALHLATKAGWLPVQSQDARSTDALAGNVGDAMRFLIEVRNMAVHPGAHVREQRLPDFTNVEHMQPTYEVCEGIMAVVFEHLSNVVESEYGDG